MSKTKKWLLISSIGITMILIIIGLSIAIVLAAQRTEVRASMNVSFVASGVNCTVAVRGKYKFTGTESIYTAITANPTSVTFEGAANDTASIETSSVELDGGGIAIYTFTITNNSPTLPVYAKIIVGDTTNLTRVLSEGDYTYLPEGQVKEGYYIAPAAEKGIDLTITITDAHLDAEADTNVSVYLYSEPESGVTRLLDQDGTLLYIADQIGETFEAPYNTVTTEINDGVTKYFQGWKKEGDDTLYAPYDLITAEANVEYRPYYSEDPTYTDLTFAERTDGTYAVRGSDSSSTTITIPVVYHGKPVSTIGSAEASSTVASIPTYDYTDNLDIAYSGGNNIIASVPEPTGNGAFESYTNLTSISLPKSITLLGANAFVGCTSLTSITLPSYLKTIGVGAFDGCEALTEIVIPESVSVIGEYAFSNCTALTTATLPDNLSVIPQSLFRGCSLLATVNCPNGVTEIGTTAFYSTALASFDMSNAKKLTTINSQAFSNTKLTAVYIPSNVTTIGNAVFSNISTLNEIRVARNNVKFSSFAEGAECNCIIQDGNILVVGCKTTTIPNTISKINDYAMLGSGKTSITIPSSVEYIGSQSFSWLSSLTSVTFEQGTKPLIIKERAFYGCNNITTLELPTRITQIEKSAFEGCTKLTSASFGLANNWKTTTSSAFSGGSAIDVSTAATNATTLKNNTTNYLYRNSTALIDMDGTVLYEYNNIGNSQEMPIDVPTISKTVGSATWYFQGWNEAGEVTDNTLWISPCQTITVTSATNYQPHYYKQIEYPKFILTTSSDGSGYAVAASSSYSGSNLNNLPVIYKGKKVVEIAENGFKNNSVITSVTIPSTITSIGTAAFAYTKITSVVVPDSVTSMGTAVFKACKRLKTAKLSNNILTIPNYTFQQCTALTSLTVSNNLQVIGQSAISTCRALTSFTIPNTVTEIKTYAFYNCSKLSSVTIPNSVTHIGSQAFYGLSSAKTLTVNASDSLDIYESAFANSGWNTVTFSDEGICYMSYSYTFSNCTSLTDVRIGDSVKLVQLLNV